MNKRHRFYRNYLKRLADVICAISAIVVFSWLYLIVAALVRLNLGSPILFKQERPGKIDPKTGKEKIFTLYKFRTMTNQRGEDGNLLPEEIRLTKFGKFLRKTSLDELPEAFNILKGDMSVIGPRPLLVRYLELYHPEQRRRHEVRPGLSGLAQVHGRNAISWEERFKLDVWYVDHVSLFLDIKLVFQTVFKAFVKQEGINSETSVTMEEFKG